jgi:hypothetical protein
MRIFTALVMIAFVAVISALPAAGDDPGVGGNDSRNEPPTIADQCRTVRTAPKPFPEAVEDCLAYVLDIPLALMSPITCPVVAPILEKWDSGPDRTFSPRRR